MSKTELSEKFLDYIDNEFFIEIVENKLNINRENFRVRFVLLEPATGKNENYTSVLYRTKIKIELNDGKRDTIQVIVKALLDNLPPEFKEFNIFYRERRMYGVFLPIFEEIWRNIGVEVQFGPKMLKYESEPYEVIVLDDLLNYDYKMCDRKVGLDLEHAKLVLSKLAKFHAASAIQYDKEGNIYKELDRMQSIQPKDIDPNNPPPMVIVFSNILKAFCENVKSWPGYEEYHEILDKWDYSKFIMSFLTVTSPMKNGFTVLNHSDMWTNNFMFKYEEEKLVDIQLIDYQMPFWGSPACDLLYFYISSIRDDVKLQNFDNLVEYYYTLLVENLKKLEYPKPIPTLEEIHADFLDKGNFAILCLMNVLLVAKQDSTEELRFDQLMQLVPEQKVILERIYKIENFTNAIKFMLPFMKERGFLNSLI